MSKETNPVRFATDRLKSDTRSYRSGEYKFFQPEANGRDRYGNRIFRSPTLFYRDVNYEPVNANLLVSPEGESFLKVEHGFLQALEMGLVNVEQQQAAQEDLYSPDREEVISDVSIGVARTLQFLAQGTFSLVFKLELNNQTLIVKIPRATYNLQMRRNAALAQPYINEMLQISALQYDLGERLASLGVILPRTLFASGLVTCGVFEEGVVPSISELNDLKIQGEHSNSLCEELHAILIDYIKLQRRNDIKNNSWRNGLWNNILPDVITQQKIPRFNNFIQRPDGALVLIDPLFQLAVDD